MSHPALGPVRAVVTPALASAGFDLEDLAIRAAGSRHLVRVVVDRDDGLTLDDVADASRTCSEALDAADVIAGTYVLEVTSPGVDRPLTAPRHWRRATGHLVRVTRRSGGAAVVGRVTECDDRGATLDIAGTPTRISYDEVSTAIVEVEFTHATEDSDGRGGVGAPLRGGGDKMSPGSRL